MNKEYNNIKIELGTLNDINELENVYNDLNDHLQLGINYPGWLKGVYPVRETAEIGIREGNLFTLKIEGKIAGSVILNHKQEKAYNQVNWGVDADDSQIMVIQTLVVHPHFMKQGISRKLMDFSKKYALSKEAKSIRLDVAIQNIPAISLYEKCGYNYIGTVDLGLGYAHLKWFKLYELLLPFNDYSNKALLDSKMPTRY